jgi:hypothetical protein
MMKPIYKYIIATIMGFSLAMLMFKGCSPKNQQNAGDKIKIDTTYIIKDKIITIHDTIVKLKYNNKYIDKYIIQEQFKEDDSTITVNWKDYFYALDTTYANKNSTTKVNINGWGYIDAIKLNTIIKDTTVIVNKEITKYIPSKGLYLSQEYIQPFDNNTTSSKSIYKVNIDYVNDKILIGTGIGIQNNNPNWSIKVGYKIN